MLSSLIVTNVALWWRIKLMIEEAQAMARKYMEKSLYLTLKHFFKLKTALKIKSVKHMSGDISVMNNETKET